ncbi:MAG: type II toxin-antitoxin system RelE/ParE family toxin [Nanoarchaeota archaeon]
MLVEYNPDFIKKISKIKNKAEKERVKKQIEKIVQNPSIGKPMRYGRQGTREVYIDSYRLAYSYTKNKIILLDLYHKDEQ